MLLDLACGRCGEEEDLRGRPGDEGISVTCGRCGNTWIRGREATCVTCGGADVIVRPRVMTQYSRGTQLSVVGWRNVLVCRICDAEMLDRPGAGGPIPADYEPRAVQRRED